MNLSFFSNSCLIGFICCSRRGIFSLLCNCSNSKSLFCKSISHRAFTFFIKAVVDIILLLRTAFAASHNVPGFTCPSSLFSKYVCSSFFIISLNPELFNMLVFSLHCVFLHLLSTCHFKYRPEWSERSLVPILHSFNLFF